MYVIVRFRSNVTSRAPQSQKYGIMATYYKKNNSTSCIISQFSSFYAVSVLLPCHLTAFASSAAFFMLPDTKPAISAPTAVKIKK